MAVINVLDKHTAELIAAGEVVEKPASVVKELVENSIDAGAKNILVDIERGGVKKILVQDDGCGIDSEYVKTAFIRHATSKISSKQDLDHIASLGFRGEALASIASVSHVELITKTDIQDFAVEIKLSAGTEESFEIKPFITGSRFIIRDLFYNTPARMKFLKKDMTEAGYIQDIITDLALSRSDIAFTLKKDGKDIFSTIGDGKLLNTVAAIFGNEFASQLTQVNYDDGKYTVTGYTTQPHFSKQSRNLQFAFINGRYVKNKTVIAACENAYKGSVMVGKFPGYLLNIKMPFDAVDVNVHPAKTEVRFANDGEMFNVVYRAVKQALNREVSLKQFTFKPQTTVFIDNNNVKQTSFTDNNTQNNADNTQYSTLNLANPIINTENTQKYIEKYVTPQMEQEDIFESGQSIKYETNKNTHSFTPSRTSAQNIVLQPENSCDNNKIAVKSADKATVASESFSQTETENIRVIGEVFSTYILCQIADDMIVVDKHAAHERILYERFKRNDKAEKQLLLVPTAVKVSAAEKAALLENIELLNSQGFEIEDFGLSGVALRAIPMNISSEDPQSLLSEIAFNLASGNKAEISQKLDWIFHSVACRSAIKAGDKADITQMTQLIHDIRSEKIPLYCPHGRPVIISITKKELEKQFGR